MKLLLPLLFLALASPLFAQNRPLQLRSVTAFPEEKIAGVWGYEQDGREYALVAGESHLHIVDVTDADAPERIISIPTSFHWGKELRTYGHYAYLSSKEGVGLTVYDLSQLPNTNVTHYLQKTITAAGGYTLIGHTLHIDTTAGTLYLNDGGANRSWVFDLKADPFSPAFLGLYNAIGGIHDGFADNDTLYAAHINSGVVAVVDMKDKSQPQVLQTFETPGHFPHNTWPTADRKHLVVADEISDGLLSIWDLSNLEDIREVARYRPTPGSGSIPHNCFVRGDYAYAAWYRDGIVMLDISRPDNPIEVDRYDTYPGWGSGFSGAWGDYPYLSSGNLLVNDIQGGLHVFTPKPVKPCYIEGQVTDARTGFPLPDVKVTIRYGGQHEPVQSHNDGQYKTGQRQAGYFQVVWSKEGYRPIAKNIKFQTGKVLREDLALLPLDQPLPDDPAIRVVAAESGLPIANTEVVLRNAVLQFSVHTDARGWAFVPGIYADTFDVFPGNWGRLPRREVEITGDGAIIELEKGFYDDFYFDLGWQVEGDAGQANWERGAPAPWPSEFVAHVPETGDIAADLGDQCFVTGLDPYLEAHTVQDKTTLLRSPEFDVRDFTQPVLHFQYCQFNKSTTQGLAVFLENGQGRELLHQFQGVSALSWMASDSLLLPAAFAGQGPCRIVFEVRDTLLNNSGSNSGALDLAVDEVQIIDAVTTSQPQPNLSVSDPWIGIYPNPFRDRLQVRYDLPETLYPFRWAVFDVLGRTVDFGTFSDGKGELQLLSNAPEGVYFFVLKNEEGVIETRRVIKQKV